MNHHIKYKKYNNYRHLSYLFALSMLVSFDVMSADWTSIKKTKDYELLVDMDSYNVADGLPFITAKTIFNMPSKLLFNGNTFVFIEELSTKQFNCKLQSYKVLETHYFNKKNVLIRTEKGVKSFEPLQPGSNNSTIASLVCQVHKMLGGI